MRKIFIERDVYKHIQKNLYR